jgi:hypothetical protein
MFWWLCAWNISRQRIRHDFEKNKHVTSTTSQDELIKLGKVVLPKFILSNSKVLAQQNDFCAIQQKILILHIVKKFAQNWQQKLFYVIDWFIFLSRSTTNEHTSGYTLK